jgi:8-amino-7-oxononanoate synthase
MATPDWMEAELLRLEAESKLRTLQPTKLLHDGWLERDGRRMLNLASNLYLGTFDDPLDSDEQAYVGNGAGASRLIVGTTPELAAFEADFAWFKGTPRCLVFGSGYAANVGTLQALAGRGTIVYSDKLNHASIVDGIVLSRAEHLRYRHQDVDHLETLLRRAPQDARKLIVTDAIFSMDGTCAPLAALVELKQRYGAMLMVDEAHSGGIYGNEGQGLVHALGLSAQVDVIMGTFSKAYASYGAYVAGSDMLARYLINRARSLMYSTALPPQVVAATRRNWTRARVEHWRRTRLWDNAALFRARLIADGFRIVAGDSPIVPLLVGDNALALRFGEDLQAEGICAVAIRPPTVPEGSARIRFSLMATHTAEQLHWAADRIAHIGRQVGLR